MKKILINFTIPNEVAARYSNEFLLDYPKNGSFTNEELNQKLPEANGFFGLSLNKEMIDIAKKLEIASCFGAGYDAFEHKYAGEKGICIMNAPNATTEPTAELTVALLLCLSRRVLNLNNLIKKEGRCGGLSLFVSPFDGAPPPTPVHGKTLGIVGLGRIGQEVAKRATALNMNVIYYDSQRLNESDEKAQRVKYLPFNELLKTADYVTLHCAYTQENHHLMDKAQFALMKPTAYFINAGRGKLMNEEALISALESKSLMGAAIDVFEFEPQVSPRLFEMENVLLTPHVGTCTYETRVNMAIEALDGLTAHLKGGVSPSIVNKEFLQK